MDIFLQVLYTFIVLGILIMVHELGHFLVAKKAKIKVNEFSLGMGPAIFKKQGKETLYALRLLPIGGYVKMEGEDEESENENSFGKKPVWSRIAVVVAGAMMNLLIGFIITFILVIISNALPSTTVAQFDENAVSSEYGLKVGDKIVKINDKNINIYTDISTALSRAYNSDTVDMLVKRDGEKVELNDVKFKLYEIAEGLNAIETDFYVSREDKNIGNILKHTFFRTLSYVSVMYETIFDLVTGRAPLKYVSGPVGTSHMIADAVKAGFTTIMSLVSLISINLCVVNLLPLPALDGGRLVFLVIEAVRGKPINQKYEAIVHFAGLIALLLLMVFITFKDILYPIM